MTSADKVIQFVFLVWDRVTSAEYALTNSIIFCCCSVFCLYKNISDWTLKFWQMWKQQSYRFFFFGCGILCYSFVFFFLSQNDTKINYIEAWIQFYLLFENYERSVSLIDINDLTDQKESRVQFKCIVHWNSIIVCIR